jgi:hypothetical protein
MAFVAILPWDLAIPENGIAVALVAGEAIVEDQCVIISRRHWAYKSFPGVAVVAVIDLGIMLAFFEMTNETGALGNRDVFTLDDLGVAACTLELFASFEVLEMDFMVERDLVERHLAFQESFVVTAFP